jgi:Rrf2 family protein
MLYSKYCEYSIRALAFMGANIQKNKYILIKDISDKTNIPCAYLHKIFQDIAVNTNWIASKKGRNGGVTLLADSKKIRMMDIIKLCDGVQTINKCILGGNKKCKQNPKCKLHDKCSYVLNEITAFYEKMTLDVVAEMNPF